MRKRISIAADALQQDVAYAVRGFLRSPAFTATVVLSILIGVAGNVTTFAVLDRLLFQSPSGVVEPDGLLRIHAREVRPAQPVHDWGVFSFPDFEDLATSVKGAAVVEGYSTARDRIVGDDGPHVAMSYVTSGLFSLLGVQPVRGRFFTPEENAVNSQAVPPVVLSFDFWTRVIGADSAIIGRRLTVSGSTFVVVGIAPSGFQGVDLEPVDLWVPLSARGPSADDRSGWATNRDSRFLSLLVRLGPDQNWDRVLSRLSAQYSHSQQGAVSSAQILSDPLLEARGSQSLGPIRDRSVSLATRLFAVALSVLLVTALNVAALLLMRAIRRRHEIAVRLALGMSRWRLASQLIVESMVLATAAGAASVVVGWWGSTLLRTTLLSTIRWPASGVDHRIVIMSAVLAVAIGLGAGLVPVLAARRYSSNALKLDTSSIDRRGSRLRGALLGLQTAVCVVLITFAGSFLQSLRNITDTNLGFDADKLIMIVGRIGGASAAQDIAEAIQSQPFVASVANAMADVAPDRARGKFAIRGQPPVPDALIPSHNLVSANYFSTVGLTMVRGRPISADDVAGSEPVVVITESMAQAFWPGRDPLGECVFAVGDTGTCRRVVGVVRDVRWQLAGAALPHFYLPLAQFRGDAGRYWLVRTRAGVKPDDVAEIERIARGFDAVSRPGVSVVRELLAPQIKPLRAASTLLLVFGLLALFLAGSGVYGLVTSEMSQRTRELGVRMALGAETRDVVRLVLASGSRVLAVGIVGGLVGAVLSGRVIAAFLFNTSPYDPLVIGVVVVITTVTSLAAMAVPGLRAARLDPVAALRAE